MPRPFRGPRGFSGPSPGASSGTGAPPPPIRRWWRKPGAKCKRAGWRMRHVRRGLRSLAGSAAAAAAAAAAAVAAGPYREVRRRALGSGLRAPGSGRDSGRARRPPRGQVSVGRKEGGKVTGCSRSAPPRPRAPGLGPWAGPPSGLGPGSPVPAARTGPAAPRRPGETETELAEPPKVMARRGPGGGGGAGRAEAPPGPPRCNWGN
ncbi:uncharacterized protein [Notamacropus eugenii]|uniref:uncharacterized protein n=1 Tax=Notamacropus eugenii TaxID=9315 RepID=UPI003B6765F4